jgi:branched-chain amino acid transport system ATP-binding protein
VTTLLDARDVTVHFGGVAAVDGVSLDIRQGEIRGLIGPNGAGKSTLFNAISGVVDSTAGRIMFDGNDISRMPVHRRAAAGLRRTFQHVQLMQARTTLENVLLGMHLASPANPLKSVLSFGRHRSADTAARVRAREVMRFLGIEHTMLREVGSLTIAQQRLIEIARALVAQPKLLMLDEPCAGLSPPAVDELNRNLVRLNREWGITILLIEHVLPLVIDVCHRVAVLENGRLIADGPPLEVMADPAVRLAYLGGDEAA